MSEKLYGCCLYGNEAKTVKLEVGSKTIHRFPCYLVVSGDQSCLRQTKSGVKVALQDYGVVGITKGTKVVLFESPEEAVEKNIFEFIEMGES